jgi:hypothetical protein
MRAATLIRAIQTREPGAHCLLAVSHVLPDGLLPPDVPVVAIGGRDGTVISQVEGFAADVIVFDTSVPPSWRELKAAAERTGGARTALVLRELRPSVLARLRAHPILREASVVLIPHLRGEFDPGLARTVHVGPVARLTATQTRERFDLLSTVGGGGHRELCEPFIATVMAADRELRRRNFHHRHLLVTGPRYDGALPDAGAVEVRRFVPGLPDLISAARVVVSRAGYNTVAEILAAGTPAILIPGDPGLDDQRGRASRLAAARKIELVEQGDVAGLARALASRLGAPPEPAVEWSAERAASDGFTLGASLAAERLLALAGTEVAHV